MRNNYFYNAWHVFYFHKLNKGFYLFCLFLEYMVNFQKKKIALNSGNFYSPSHNNGTKFCFYSYTVPHSYIVYKYGKE